MIVLGIHDGHCASACVLVNGTVKAIAAEERFTRLKNDHGYPFHAVNFCLAQLALKPGDIDHVAFAGQRLSLFGVKLKALTSFTSEDWLRIEKQHWHPLLYEGRHDEAVFHELYADPRFNGHGHYYDFSQVTAQQAIANDADTGLRIRLEAVQRHLGIGAGRVGFYDHHRCHAAYAFFGSPLRQDNTLIFTLDGGGDGATSSLFRFAGNRLEELARTNESPVARIYRYITLMLGMKLGEHEYKVMGLAPYAPQREFAKSWKVYQNLVQVRDDLIRFDPDHRPRDLYFHFRQAFEGHRFDGIAAATQHLVEQSVGEWFDTALARYGAHHAVFAGGVAMNVKLNMMLAGNRHLKRLHVPPSPSDDTLSIGAAYLGEFDHDPAAVQRLAPIDNPYLGPRFDRRRIDQAIAEAGLADAFRLENGVTPDRIAEILSRGKVVARMGGPMEFGQRALGNRSILADPRDERIVDKINHQIKYRDFWMPFAPVVRAERVHDYFKPQPAAGERAWDYMMFGAETTALGARELGAALHRGDGTGRPQVVARHQNPDYYDILRAFEKRTGVGGLLNTSFNLHGEPIVCSPQDAISTFERSELDVLVMEDVAVHRGMP